MRFSTFATALLSVGYASAALITVKVGGDNNTLIYDPPYVNASNGDTIAFQFMFKNHTVTQSSFGTPCTNLSDNGLDSGFQNIPAGSTSGMEFSFNMTNTTGPLWFYCRQTVPVDHCAMGMVFAVNPTPEKSFQAFQQAAMATGSTNPGNSTTNSTTASSSPSGSSASSTASQTADSSSNSQSSSPSSSGSSTAPSTSTTPNAAFKMTTTAGMILSGVGLVAGLVL